MTAGHSANVLSRSKRIGIASVLLLVLTVSLGAFLGVQTRAQFREIEASWANYADDVSRKGVWISSIRGHLGYGGIIHNFKNYVLRQDPQYLDRTRDQIEQFNAVIAEYLDQPLNPDERMMIEVIQQTIDEYARKLPLAMQAAQEGWSAERTDAAVRVEDARAIQALADLEVLWRATHRVSTDRVFAAVEHGTALIWVGFASIFALVLSALLIGFLLILLLRDMRRAMAQLSDELQMRRALEQSNERLARAVDQSPATIFMTDTDARILYANRRFEQLTGWSRDEVIGKTPRFLQSGDTPRSEYDAIRERLERGEDWHGVFRNRRKGGGSYWAETSILPLLANDGSVQNFIGIGEDITEKRQAREQVARAQKLEAVGLLAGGIAHDFNNILTTIVGASHLAAMDAPEGSDIAAEIDQIDIAARRAQSLVRGLLTFARREPGQPQPNDLCEITHEVLRLLRAAMPPTIRLDCSGVNDRVMVMGDHTHLHQIVMNLCRNAAEAIGAGNGTIHVTVRVLGAELPDGLEPRDGGWVQFEVRDDGPGMSAETLRHLFDPFYTTKPLGKGSGLGLAVVSSIIEEMKGTIDVESAPGQGACFTVRLPGAEGLVAQAEAVNADVPRGRERLILVDDETEIAATFRRFLLRLGYQVEAFTAPAIALEHIRADPARPDLLISDMVMPEMSGEELVNAVRALRPDLPVIFCTGYNPSGVTVTGPAPELLNKPVDPALLARRIRSLLDARA